MAKRLKAAPLLGDSSTLTPASPVELHPPLTPVEIARRAEAAADLAKTEAAKPAGRKRADSNFGDKPTTDSAQKSPRATKRAQATAANAVPSSLDVVGEAGPVIEVGLVVADKNWPSPSDEAPRTHQHGDEAAHVAGAESARDTRADQQAQDSAASAAHIEAAGPEMLTAVTQAPAPLPEPNGAQHETESADATARPTAGDDAGAAFPQRTFLAAGASTRQPSRDMGPNQAPAATDFSQPARIWTDWLAENVERQRQATRELMQCRTPNDLVRVQTDLIEHAMDSWTQANRRFVSLLGGLRG